MLYQVYSHDNLEPVAVALTLYRDALTLLLKKYSGLRQLQLVLSHGTGEKQQHIKLVHRYTYALPCALGSWKWSYVQLSQI